MKNLINKLSLRYALTMIICLFAVSQMAWADGTKSSRKQVNFAKGMSLEPGHVYIVRQTMTIESTNGAGIEVKKGSGQAPILYIPKDVTLTVKGADGKGSTPGYPGIWVPSDAKLIITGAGTLIATGGNAGNGSDGTDGGNPHNLTYTAGKDFADWVNDLHQSGNMNTSGKGGNGGAGGGGAAAGIGGIGGEGGAGGAGAKAVNFLDNLLLQERSQKDGGDGGAGGKGKIAGSMGTVYIMGHVTVTAAAGQASTVAGQGGKQGWSFVHQVSGSNYVAGAGGAGGGGGAGYAVACGIGAGAPGAGGGAGGGSGAVDWTTLNWGVSQNNSSGRAASGKGGAGNAKGVDGEQTRPRDNGPSGIGGLIFEMKGGNVLSPGTKGDDGNSGKLFVGTNATINDKKGDVPDDYNGTKESSDPGDMNISLIFINNEFNSDGTQASNVSVGTISAVIGESLPNVTEEKFVLTAENKYFAGYYTSDKGLGTRAYKGIAGTDTKLAPAIIAVPFAEDQNIYAHFSHNEHSVVWDYTYKKIGEGGYADVSDDQRVKKARLTFYFRDGKSAVRILTAANAAGSGTEQTHLTTTSAITLRSSGAETLSGNTINIVLPDDSLAQFVGYMFEPLNNSYQVPTNWLLATDKTTHNTEISFTGADASHCYDLTWEVTLKDLKTFPDVIYVKPMYENGSTYSIISQLADTDKKHYDGVICTQKTLAQDGLSCTYTGSYPVWKKDDSNNDYRYKIGLVGFMLKNVKYYMDSTPGNVHEDMVSKDTYNSANNISTCTNNITVKMDIAESVIPVLRLDPNATDATLASGTPEIIINEARDGNYNLNGYKAVRYGYSQTGWNRNANPAEQTQENHYNLDVTLTGIRGALTLYAEWKEAVPPTITTVGVTYGDDKAIFHVKVTDNEALAAEHAVQYFVSVADVDPKTYEGTWIDATPGTEYLYGCDVTLLPKAYVYVKATDAAGNESYAASGEVKTDGIAPTYNIYPTGNVCNYDSKIKVADNFDLHKIEIAHTESAAGEEDVLSWTEKWTRPAGDTHVTSHEYTLAKPTDEGYANGEGYYSLRVTDVAGNETEYRNFIHMYYNHAWDTEHAKHCIYIDEHGDYIKKTYYECAHECGHVWVVNYKVGDTTFGEPGSGETGYKHESKLAEPAKTYQEQGLMREDTQHFIDEYGTVAIDDANGIHVGVANGINEAIAKINDFTPKSSSYTLTLVDDTNISEYKSGETGSKEIATPSVPVTIELNGNGLLVDKNPCTEGDGITGNSSVTILLNDDGYFNYANESKVTSTPIKYKRHLFSEAQKGSWQSLYLPFSTTAISTCTFGEIAGVKISSAEAELQINKLDANVDLEAERNYFVRANEDFELTATSGILLPYAKPQEVNVPGLDTANDTKTYTICGSLNNGDQVATQQQTFWVLTNGGAFWFAQAGSHQRPYRWVIFDKDATTPQIRPRTLSYFVIEPTPTGISQAHVMNIDKQSVYTLDGRKMTGVANLKAGMYIVGGKKVVIK